MTVKYMTIFYMKKTSITQKNSLFFCNLIANFFKFPLIDSNGATGVK